MSFSNSTVLRAMVRVLEAQDERAAGVPGVQVVEQRRPGGPDVERAGGARGDPDARDGSTAVSAPGRRGTAPDRRRRAGRGRAPPGRRPRVARPRGPSRVSESSEPELDEDRDVGAGRQRPRLEVRQQARVLLGLLRDPVDGGVASRPRSRSGGTPAGRLARGLGIDRVAVRAGHRVAEHLVEAGLDPGRDGALEAHRLVVRLGPAETDDRGQQPLEERVPPEDAVRGGPAGGRQVELAAVGDGRRARPRRAGGTSRWRPGWSPRHGGRPGRRYLVRLRAAGHDAEGAAGTAGRRWTGRGDRGVVGMASGYGTGRVRGQRDRGPRRSRRPIPTEPGEHQHDAEDAGRRRGRRLRPPAFAVTNSVAGTATTRLDAAPRRPPSRRRSGARAGGRRRATCKSQTIGSVPSSQVAEKRPHPVTSPAAQPIAEAIGSQPMIARAIRQPEPTEARPSSAHERLAEAVAGRSPGASRVAGSGRAGWRRRGRGAGRGAVTRRPHVPARSAAPASAGSGRGVPPGRRRVARGRGRLGPGAVRPPIAPTGRPGVRRRSWAGPWSRRRPPQRLAARPALARPARPGLVLRSVLARVRVLLRD